MPSMTFRLGFLSAHKYPKLWDLNCSSIVHSRCLGALGFGARISDASQEIAPADGVAVETVVQAGSFRDFLKDQMNHSAGAIDHTSIIVPIWYMDHIPYLWYSVQVEDGPNIPKKPNPPNSKVWGSLLEKGNAPGWMARGSELGARGRSWGPAKPDKWRWVARGSELVARGSELGAGWHAERNWGPLPHTSQRQSGGARHTERWGTAPEPDTDSAEHRHRQCRGPTEKVRECRNPTQRALGPDIETGGRAPGRDPD